MTHRFAIALAGIGVSAMAATASYAQPAESVNVDVAECLELDTREQQLECYESRVAETLRTRDRAATSEPAPATVSRAESGRPEPVQRAEPLAVGRSDDAADEPASEIVATVTRLREMEPNAYMIYLDNGQIWRQNRPKRYPLMVDAEVRLRPTNWGPSYRLTDPDRGGFIQVERIQ